MIDSIEKRDLLDTLIEETKEHRDDQRALVKRRTQLGQDPTAAETALRETKDVLAILRAQRKALDDDH